MEQSDTSKDVDSPSPEQDEENSSTETLHDLSESTLSTSTLTKDNDKENHNVTTSPTCSSSSESEYNEFLKRMNLRYSHFATTSGEVHCQSGRTMESVEYSNIEYPHYSYATSSSNWQQYTTNDGEEGGVVKDQYGQQDNLKNSSCCSSIQSGSNFCYPVYAQSQSLPQNVSCHSYNPSHLQQQQQYQPMAENYAYTTQGDSQIKETVANSENHFSTVPNINSTTTQNYSLDSGSCCPRRTNSQAQEYIVEQDQRHSQGMGRPTYGYSAAGTPTVANMGMSGQPSGMSMPNINSCASTAGYASMANMSGGYSGMSMGMDSNPNFMQKFNQNPQQCYHQNGFGLNDQQLHINSYYSQSLDMNQGYANNIIQTQTVYTSDYKPYAGGGNQFNHFPHGNNGYMMNSEPAAGYGGGQAYGMGGVCEMDAQSYPVGQMGYPYPYSSDMPMSASGETPYLPSAARCGLNSKTNSG